MSTDMLSAVQKTPKTHDTNVSLTFKNDNDSCDLFPKKL